MGWNLELFEGDVDESLICVICTEVFKDPVNACINGHDFCKGCLAQCTADSCPTCREGPLTKRPSRALNKCILARKVRCQNRSSEGGQPPSRRQRVEGSSSSTSGEEKCSWEGALSELQGPPPARPPATIIYKCAQRLLIPSPPPSPHLKRTSTAPVSSKQLGAVLVAMRY
jgi:hypothetical protein